MAVPPLPGVKTALAGRIQPYQPGGFGGDLPLNNSNPRNSTTVAWLQKRLRLMMPPAVTVAPGRIKRPFQTAEEGMVSSSRPMGSNENSFQESLFHKINRYIL